MVRARRRACAEGVQVVVAGGCDYYPGSASASPSFSFAVSDLRVAGEGDLLAQIERLRQALAAEGLLERQQRLPRPLLPRTIGVVTGEGGKARDDVLAGLHRRGWAGRVVWAFAPVQDRHAAPAIARALQDLAAVGGVEWSIVARGGGSLADLLCFSDETLCRTVALLAVPVIASVGHHTDRTLLDDVAAVSCSTPTHAAEEAVRLDCVRAAPTLAATAARLRGPRRRAVLGRARMLAALSRAPRPSTSARQRRRLHQQLREIRAAARRRVARERTLAHARARARAGAPTGAARTRRLPPRAGPPSSSGSRSRSPRHDPQRTLERGYALVQGPGGEPLTTRGAGHARPGRRARCASPTGRRRREDRGDGARGDARRAAGASYERQRRASRRSSAAWTRARRAWARRSSWCARARR